MAVITRKPGEWAVLCMGTYPAVYYTVYFTFYHTNRSLGEFVSVLTQKKFSEESWYKVFLLI